MVRRSSQVWFYLGAEWQESHLSILLSISQVTFYLKFTLCLSLRMLGELNAIYFFLDRSRIRRVDVSQLKSWLEFRRWMGLKGKMGCGWGTPCVVSTCSELGVTLTLWEGRFILWPPKSRRCCPKNRYCYTTPTAQLQWVRQALFITASPPKPHSNKQHKPPDLSHQAR